MVPHRVVNLVEIKIMKIAKRGTREVKEYMKGEVVSSATSLEEFNRSSQYIRRLFPPKASIEGWLVVEFTIIRKINSLQ